MSNNLIPTYKKLLLEISQNEHLKLAIFGSDYLIWKQDPFSLSARFGQLEIELIPGEVSLFDWDSGIIVIYDFTTRRFRVRDME